MTTNLRRVLHVDDDPTLLRVMAARLRKHDFEVVSVEDPREAIPLLLGEDIRIVLLDIDLPTLSGLQLLEQIKQHDGGIQVIMLTGLVSMATILESLRRGAEACHFKPLDDVAPLVESLEATVAKLDCWWRTLRDMTSRRRLEAGGSIGWHKLGQTMERARS